jgi:GLPGLI family protein
MKKRFLASALSLIMALSGLYAQQTQVFTFSTGSSGKQFGMNTGTPVKQKEIGKAAMEFIYDYHYLNDTTNVASVVKDQMILQVSYGMSKFFSYSAMQIDSLVSVSSIDQIQANPDRYVGGETFSVYKNYPTGKFTYIDKISTDWFSYEEDIPVQEWKLTDGDKEVLGYQCHRAECDFRGRKYNAWYTDEIPVADGPWKFGGLPGFIVEVSDSEGHYSFTLVGITSKATRNITLPDVQFNKTSRDKFYSTKRKFDTDPIGYLSAVSGVNVVITTPDGSPNNAAMQARELRHDYIERDYKR